MAFYLKLYFITSASHLGNLFDVLYRLAGKSNNYHNKTNLERTVMAPVEKSFSDN